MLPGRLLPARGKSSGGKKSANLVVLPQASSAGGAALENSAWSWDGPGSAPKDPKRDEQLCWGR